MSWRQGASYNDDNYDDEEDTSELLLSLRASDRDQDTESDEEDPDDREYGCCAYFLTILMYLFTDWPWKTVKYISMPYMICDDINGAQADTNTVTEILAETSGSAAESNTENTAPETVTRSIAEIQATNKNPRKPTPHYQKFFIGVCYIRVVISNN